MVIYAQVLDNSPFPLAGIPCYSFELTSNCADSLRIVNIKCTCMDNSKTRSYQAYAL